MATITINNSVYNDVKYYADKQNTSVEEVIVSIIRKFIPSKKRAKYKMKNIEELSPELQQIIGFAKPSSPQKSNGINGDNARMDYISKKYKK